MNEWLELLRTDFRTIAETVPVIEMKGVLLEWYINAESENPWDYFKTNKRIFLDWCSNRPKEMKGRMKLSELEWIALIQKNPENLFKISDLGFINVFKYWCQESNRQKLSQFFKVPNYFMKRYARDQVGQIVPLTRERELLKAGVKNDKTYIYYDLDKIKEIPIRNILEDHGIQVDPTGFFKIRDEKTPSCKIYTQSNSYHDFGDSSGGNGIQLICTMMGFSDWKDGARYLSESYGIPYLHSRDPQSDFLTKHITNLQYEKIGIQPERASMNINFLVSEDAIEYSYQLSEKLSMPMNELFEKYPGTYEKIISDRAVPKVNFERQQYLYQIYQWSAAKPGIEKEVQQKNLEDSFQEYKKLYQVLSKAAEGTHLKTAKLNPDISNDLQRILSGKINIEIGDYPYYKLKDLPGANVYRSMTIQEYQGFSQNLTLDHVTWNCPYSAFFNVNQGVTITVKETEALEFDRAFEAYMQYQDDRQNFKKQPISAERDLEL